MQITKFIILFSIFSLLITVDNSISQNFPVIDSLERLLEQSSGIEKANLLKEIGGNYTKNNNHKKAITYYQQSLKIYDEGKDTLQQAIVSRKIGTTYYQLFDYDKALGFYLKALKKFEQINDQDGILITLLGIGSTYSNCYNNDKALEYYSKAYEISEQTGNQKGLYIALNNIGLVYFLDIKNYDKALEYFNKSLLLMKESNDSSNISAPIQNIALVYYKMQEYDTALYYYFKALKLNEELKQNSENALITSNIAILYIQMNDLKSAKKYLDRSFKISKEIDSKPTLKINYFYYTLFYALKGDLINMRKYSDLYDAITDTIFNDESSRLIAEMQIKYETEKQQLDNDLLKKDLILKEKISREQSLIQQILIGGLIGFLVILILLIYSLKFKIKSSRQLKKLFEKEKRFNRLHIDKIEAQNREMSMATLHIINKNEVLSNIKNSIESVIKSKKSNAYEYQNIIKLINDSLNLDEDWDQFKRHFEQVHQGFFQRLKEQYPDLTKNDLKLCAYLRINLSTKEISQMLNVLPTSIAMRRNRLRKKLNITQHIDLIEFMSTV